MDGSKVSNIDLRPSRILLNPHFDSYKLSLETFQSVEMKLDSNAVECYKPESCLSFHHASIFSGVNSLALNRINEKESTLAVFFLENGDMVLADLNNMFSKQIVWRVPGSENNKTLTFSACFVNFNLLIVEDGAGRVYLLEIKGFPDPAAVLLLRGSVDERGKCQTSVVTDNAMINGNGEITLFSLAVEYVKELPEWAVSKLASTGSEESGFVTSVYWQKMSKSESGDWCLSTLGHFASSSTCSLTLVAQDGSVLLGGERPFINIMLPEEYENESSISRPSEGRIYSWYQDNDSVTVTFPSIHINTKKNDILVEFKPDSISVNVNNEEVRDNLEIDGILGGTIDVEGSTWIIDDSPEFVKDPYASHKCVKKLEVTLKKSEPITWINCINDDEKGHMILTDAQLDYARDFTQTGMKHPRQSIYDDDEPEDVCAKLCKNGDDRDNEAAIQWFDQTGRLSTVIRLGSAQDLLFSRTHPNVDVCIKHDVDGCIWRMNVDTNSDGNTVRFMEHISTFDALAYVLASKENRRFTSCTPDLNLAATADCRHHVYLYRQPAVSSLKNRKIGGNQTVSRQHVIAIDPPDESIIGFQMTNSAIFVLTPKRFVRYSLKHDD